MRDKPTCSAGEPSYLIAGPALGTLMQSKNTKKTEKWVLGSGFRKWGPLTRAAKLPIARRWTPTIWNWGHMMSLEGIEVPNLDYIDSKSERPRHEKGTGNPFRWKLTNLVGKTRWTKKGYHSRSRPLFPEVLPWLALACSVQDRNVVSSPQCDLSGRLALPDRTVQLEQPTYASSQNHDWFTFI